MKKTFVTLVALAVLPLVFSITGCPNAGDTPEGPNVEMYRLEDQPSREEAAALFCTDNGFPTELSNSWKIWGHANPLFTQAFGADPDVLVFNDRLYVFMSNDTIQYNAAGDFLCAATDPEGHGPSYLRGIQGIRIMSTSDMVNWTDHGAVNIVGTPNTNPLILPQYWRPVAEFRLPNGNLVERSWAPTAAWSMIGGSPRFFLYWGDGGNGVGVVASSSPTGPWTSPLGSRLLIDHSTPGSDGAVWLFDPGVYVDPVSGRGYMFLGGGWPLPGDLPFGANNTGQARRVRLGRDMISLAGPLEAWHVPF
ncbi:MAG: family 43 glycosylhydrolase, partial [Treponema sp.]|nr:family 43 glycosylhydrolase [Treponema sp.]